MRFRSNIILNIPQYYFHMAAILKMAAIFSQQHIVRVVHLEVVQGGLLNTLIPNTCLQQPMSGKPGLPPGYHGKANLGGIIAIPGGPIKTEQSIPSIFQDFALINSSLFSPCWIGPHYNDTKIIKFG